MHPDPPAHPAAPRGISVVIPRLNEAEPIAAAVVRWIEGGFGRVDEANGLLFGVLLLIDRLQILTTGYLLSSMALPRPTTTRQQQP